MPAWFRVLALFAISVAAPAAVTPVASVPAGLTVRDLAVAPADVVLTPRGGTLHILWDLYPQRAHGSALDASTPLEPYAQALAAAVAAQRFPGMKHFIVLLVEFPQRDSYGTPLYDRAITLGRFEYRRRAAALVPVPKQK